MTAYAFGLRTPRDLLEKARREVKRLAEAEGAADAAEIQDAAINAAWTLWHLCDWIARSSDQAYIDAIERIRVSRPSAKTSRLAILQEHVLDDSHMALCEALANGAKHLTLHEPPRFDVSRIMAVRHGAVSPPNFVFPGTAAVTLSADVSAMPSVEAMLPRFVAKLRLNDSGIPA